MSALPTILERQALISACGAYRYWLSRRWAEGPCLLFVMLNPSTADANKDDPTIRRCVRFAADHGFGALQVVNLFAFRATKPADLKAAGYPVGPDNDMQIVQSLSQAGEVCVAWGDKARRLPRAAEVLALIRAQGRSPKCLEVTKHGIPSHPLMLAASCRLSAFAAA